MGFAEVLGISFNHNNGSSSNHINNRSKIISFSPNLEINQHQFLFHSNSDSIEPTLSAAQSDLRSQLRVQVAARVDGVLEHSRSVSQRHCFGLSCFQASQRCRRNS
ncbi:hypothetical protein Sjap_001254 [Stephania japonica]|uniref:Uncharacterized protein n=1 Tax=Stephania japonica TaxID=461633 RepID=A0AAP0PTB8_9MAGN